MQGVLFDVDDTLVDHGGAQDRAIRGHLASLGLPHEDAAVQQWSAAEERHFARHIRGELTFQGQRRARVRDMLGADLDDATADAWFAGYTARFEAAWAAYDDVASALDLLASRKLAVGIVTNVAAAHQRRKLSAVGLGDRFEVVVGLDTLGVGKPDPRVFWHACKLIGSAPAETAFVGDRFDHDALGARDAGLLAVWLDRHGRHDTGLGAAIPEGITRVTDLTELDRVLR